MRIELGQRVADTITGMTGIVIATTDWLNGCRRITVQAEQMHEGKPAESFTFDEPQMRVVDAFTPHNTAAPEPYRGGDQPAPSRAPDPR